jgi:hypothetical protein
MFMAQFAPPPTNAKVCSSPCQKILLGILIILTLVKCKPPQQIFRFWALRRKFRYDSAVPLSRLQSFLVDIPSFSYPKFTWRPLFITPKAQSCFLALAQLNTETNISLNIHIVAHLYELGNNKPGKLTLFEADLLTDGSFDAAIAGCTYVFHTASPFTHQVADPQRDLIEPAQHGTINVMNSVVKHKDHVKRVIVTSSVAAVRGVGSVPKNGPLFNEEDWNTVATIDTFVRPKKPRPKF